MEVVREHVGGTCYEEHEQEREHRNTKCRALGSVAWPVQQVVHGCVAGVFGFDRRPHLRDREHNARDDQSGDEYLKRDGVAKARPFPSREDTQGSVKPTHVPVRLHGVGNLGCLVGAKLPNRVDLSESTKQCNHTGHQEDEARGLGCEDRHHGSAHDVVFGATLALELRVLLGHQEHQVGSDETHDDGWDQQNVQGVEATDDHGAREVATKEQGCHC